MAFAFSFYAGMYEGCEANKPRDCITVQLIVPKAIHLLVLAALHPSPAHSAFALSVIHSKVVITPVTIAYANTARMLVMYARRACSCSAASRRGRILRGSWISARMVASSTRPRRRALRSEARMDCWTAAEMAMPKTWPRARAT